MFAFRAWPARSVRVSCGSRPSRIIALLEGLRGAGHSIAPAEEKYDSCACLTKHARECGDLKRIYRTNAAYRGGISGTALVRALPPHRCPQQFFLESRRFPIRKESSVPMTRLRLALVKILTLSGRPGTY